MSNISVVYYTCNYLEKDNPLFLFNTKKQLAKAIGDLPLIVVSHAPVLKGSFFGYEGEYKNIVVGDIGRHHLNIYKQILLGAKEAKTDYVAMAEDDVLYSYEHFHSKEILQNLKLDTFVYDMMKVSLFTWTEPPIFSFRTKRKVVNQLIAPRKMLIEAMEERFTKYDKLIKEGRSEDSILKFWGDPGRYERQLGVTERKTFEANCNNPSIVFSHPKAYGYLNHGNRKRHGDLRIVELEGWGRADTVLDLWGKVERE